MRAQLAALLTFVVLLLTACDYDYIETKCNPDNRCWAKSPAWDSSAQATTGTRIASAEQAGAWIPSPTTAGDDCWRLLGSDAHVCVVYLSQATLVGRPASELILTTAGPTCEFDGIWTSTAESLGLCFGLLDGVEIQLEINP